jgi:hypothetical protein
MRKALAIVSLASLLAAPVALAQDRGTTTGPEGSEIGKGGYEPGPGGSGSFSLQVDGGGAFPIEGSFDTPLFVGGTMTYWIGEFYRLDFSGAYIPQAREGRDGEDRQIVQALVGPSFRAFTFPVAISLGVQAGASVPDEGDVHFLISPRVALDFLVDSPLLLGLAANYDWAVDDNDRSIVRAYLSVGLRF